MLSKTFEEICTQTLHWGFYYVHDKIALYVWLGK